MKFVLLHPPAKCHIRNLRTESLGLAYIAAVLRRDGHEVEILDAYLRDLNGAQAVKEILAREFDVLAITAVHPHKNVLVSIVRAVRAKRKDAIIAVGGYLPTFSAAGFLAMCPEADLLVRGEGEAVASDVFGRIARGEEWRDAPGVAYLRDGSPVINPTPPIIADLDSLPFPARDALKFASEHVEPAIYTSRGCYHNCSFCSLTAFYALSGKKPQRYRSAGNICDEVEQVISETGRSTVVFVADDFIGPGKENQVRAVQLADEIRARKLAFKFSIECRADEVEEDTLSALKEAGLTRVFMGLESGVQRQLDTFNKHLTVEQNRRAVEIVRRVGIGLHCGFIMYDPYTTPDELLENMRFLKEMKLDVRNVPISNVTLYPGAPLVEKVRADGLLIEKGMELSYRFRDPQTAFSWKMACAVNGYNELASRIRRCLKMGPDLDSA